MENVDWRHLTNGSSGLTGQARSQLNRMLGSRLRRSKKKMKIYKYLSINKNTISSLIENYFYFSKIDEINDPFDCRRNIKVSKNVNVIQKWIKSHETVDDESLRLEVKEIIEHGKEIFLNEEPLVKNNFVRLLCFSKKNDDILMWSHYADSHKGICLEYEATQFDSKPVIEIQEKQIQSNNFWIYDKGLLPLYPVKYSKKMPYAYDFMKGEDKSTMRFALTKHTSWKYEQELRSILTDDMLPSEQRVYYKKEILTGVIFGFKISEKDRKLINSIIFTYYSINKPIIYNAEPVNGLYKLKIIKYN